MNVKEALRLSGVPVIVASLCCLAPIVVVLFGLGSVSVATALTNVLDGQYRWVFLLAGIIVLGISLFLYFRKHGICTLDQAKRRKTEMTNAILVVVFTTVVSYIVFFYGFLNIIGKSMGIWP